MLLLVEVNDRKIYNTCSSENMNGKIVLLYTTIINEELQKLQSDSF